MANENEQNEMNREVTSEIKSLLETLVAGSTENREFQQSTRTALESLAAEQAALRAAYAADKAAAEIANSSVRPVGLETGDRALPTVTSLDFSRIPVTPSRIGSSYPVFQPGMYSHPGVITPGSLPSSSRIPPPPGGSPPQPALRPLSAEEWEIPLARFPASSDSPASSDKAPAQNQPVTSTAAAVAFVTPGGSELVTNRPELTEMELFRKMVDDKFRAVHSKMHSATSSAPEIDRLVAETGRTPFSKEISRVKIGDAGKVRLPKYSGTTNPKSHMTAFRIAMGRAHLYEHELEAGYCQLFAENLTGAALDWFSRLEEGSISSFQKLSTEFLKHYSMLVEDEATMADLWNTQQTNSESLKGYMTRFKSIMAKIPNIDNDSALTALKNGLWHDSRFREEMIVNRPPTIEDAIHRASNFARAEEERSFLAKKHGIKKSTPGSLIPGNSQGVGPNRKGNTIPKKAEAPPGFAFNVNDGNRSEATNKKWTRDPNAYCEFHKSNGHSTLNCETMRKVLAEKFAKGELKGIDLGPPPKKKTFNSQPRGNPSPGKRGRNDEQDTQPEPQTKPRIDCIIGGSKFCRESINSIKAHQRQLKNTSTSLPTEGEDEVLISFKGSEVKGLVAPHDDALVVELDVSNCIVSRILIDGGSSVDAIFRKTLNRMNIDEIDIEREPTELTGFNGLVTPSMGVIKLPVQAAGINKLVEFVVLDCPSPFNMILGRPWIHSMKAVPSTYHQCVRFPTPNGIAEIRGSQEASRMCYMSNHKIKKELLNGAP